MRFGVAFLLLGLFYLPHVRAADPDVAALEFACIDDDQQQWLDAALALRREAAATLQALAQDKPRILLLPALIHIRQGKLDDALADYDWALAVLPEGSRARKAAVADRDHLVQQIAIARDGVSAYAGAGYLLVDELAEVPGRDGQSYRLLAWQKNECGFPSASGPAAVEVFQGASGAPPLKRGEILGQGLTFGADSVILQGPAQDPLIAIRSYTGGNCGGCQFVRALRLGEAALAELTLPDGSPGPISRLKRVDDSDQVLALSADLRWAFYGGLCHACSPGVVTLYRLEGRDFVAACRDYPAYYEERIGDLADGTGAEVEFQFRMGRVLTIVLNQAQLGELAAAQATLARFLEPLTTVADGDQAAWAKATLDDLGGGLARLAAAPPQACPLLGL